MYALYPHIKKEVHESLRNDNWATEVDEKEAPPATAHH